MNEITIDLRTRAEAAAKPARSDYILDIPIPPLDPTQIGQMAATLFRVVERFPPHARIAVFCAKGKRSALAAAMLQQAGYVNVADLGGVP